MLLFFCLALPLAAESNLAPIATVTTSPALDGEVDALVDGLPTGKAFVVNSEGPGSVTLAWEQPRRIHRAPSAAPG
ncbi:MAG: hypothetical protein HUU35_17090 [Armatimonadetes bacterium]|nr:hypothetical protein [Armatimonadota bacterium]